MVDKQRPLRILQVSTVDLGGGAARSAWNLFQAYRTLGHHSWLAVGHKRSSDSDVFVIPGDADESVWRRALWAIHGHLEPLEGHINGAYCLRSRLRDLVNVRRDLEKRLGVEDFNFLGTYQLTGLPPQLPDIVHCHNLHGGYFDLRVLPWLSHEVPVILNLRDAWLLSGHCAHSFDCERWKMGCGQCPDMSIYPAIKRDATAWNWRRKRSIYRRSRFYVTTPSRWLMNKVQQSILATAIIEARVIPNAVDLSTFRPEHSQIARAELGLPADADILLFVARKLKRNAFKDYVTLRGALEQLTYRNERKQLLLIALGEDAPPEQIGQAEIRFVPYQKDQTVVARYYQAADVYVHAAKADTFPNTVLEALACGTPVVATAVGGIPEQIRDGETGFLTPPGNPVAMGSRLEQLLGDEDSRQWMGRRAADDARCRFNLERQVNDFLRWYHEIIEHREDLCAAQP